MAILINNYSVIGDCSNLTIGEVFFNITGDSPGWAVSEISTSGLLPTSASTSTYYVDNLPSGSYFVEITDSAFDTLIVPIYISSGTCISIEVTGTTCGFSNGTLTATTEHVYGPIDFYLYDINDNLVNFATDVTNDYIFNGLSANTYYVIADDGGGCTGRSESCIITPSNQINFGFYVVNDANCVSSSGNGKIFITGLTGNPPFTYLWSNGETTQNVENLLSGSYSVTVTDNYGCQLTQTTLVTNVNPVTFGSFITTPPTCFGNDGSVEVIIVDGTGPYYYSGSNGDTVITFSQSYTFVGLSSGNFSVFVQDAGLCSFTNSTALITPNAFSIVSINTTNSSCGNNGQIDIILNNGTPSGTFTYTLIDSLGGSTSETTSATNKTFSNLPSDTYTIIITNGTCSYTTIVTISNTILFTISASTTGTTCGFSNGSVQITASTGGTLPYTYEISGYPPSPQTIYNNLPSGTYTATVTDLNGCSQTTNFTINPSNGVFFDLFTTQPVNGNDGEIQTLIYYGEPPFTYNWTPNVGTGPLVTGLSAGTYTLEVVDNNGCTYTKSTLLDGTNKLSNYQVFNICSSPFQKTDIIGKRGIYQMFNEGYYDLTFDDINCKLNTAQFILETSVDGEYKQINFYSSSGITDFPSDVLWVNTVVETIKTYEGIGDVIVDYQKNTIQIFNTCVTTGSTCNQQNVNLLSDAKITINLLIDYDISCEFCGLPPTPTPTTTPTPTPTPSITPTVTPTPTPTISVTPTNTPPPTPSPSPVYSFVSVWKTLSPSTSITLPLTSTGNYNFIVNWGDSTSGIVNTWNSPQASHTYSSAGTYIITITGTIDGWSFNASSSARNIYSVTSWGQLKLGNNGSNFYGCSNLDLSTVIDVLDLTGVNNLQRAFASCTTLTTINNVDLWDVSSVITFKETFVKDGNFDDNLSNWDMSNVQTTNSMFTGCQSFNNGGSPLIDNWNTINVLSMASMFSNCPLFNQPIVNWDTSSVNSMSNMFAGSISFNQNIGSWDVSSVTNMSNMFSNAIVFEQDLSGWDISNVTNMIDMFANVSLSTVNYNSLLLGWASLTVQPNVQFNGGNSFYSAFPNPAASARSVLTSGPNNWIITDSGPI
jgi:surface protein